MGRGATYTSAGRGEDRGWALAKQCFMLNLTRLIPSLASVGLGRRSATESGKRRTRSSTASPSLPSLTRTSSASTAAFPAPSLGSRGYRTY